MAHKKGGGSTRNGRDSNAQRLGVKVFGSEMIQPGAICNLGTKRFFCKKNFCAPKKTL